MMCNSVMCKLPEDFTYWRADLFDCALDQIHVYLIKNEIFLTIHLQVTSQLYHRPICCRCSYVLGRTMFHGPCLLNYILYNFEWDYRVFVIFLLHNPTLVYAVVSLAISTTYLFAKYYSHQSIVYIAYLLN